MRMNLKAAGLILLTSILSGCSSSAVLTTVGDFISGRGFTKTDLEQITIKAETDANRTSPTAIDVVFVYDESVFSLLPKTGPEWFKKKDELEANLSKFMDISPVEIPPTFVLKSVTLPKRYSTALKVVAYANYLNKKGQKPIELGSFIHPQLTLKAKTIVYGETKKEG